MAVFLPPLLSSCPPCLCTLSCIRSFFSYPAQLPYGALRSFNLVMDKVTVVSVLQVGLLQQHCVLHNNTSSRHKAPGLLWLPSWLWAT